MESTEEILEEYGLVDNILSSPAATGRGSMDSPPETAGNDEDLNAMEKELL